MENRGVIDVEVQEELETRVGLEKCCQPGDQYCAYAGRDEPHRNVRTTAADTKQEQAQIMELVGNIAN